MIDILKRGHNIRLNWRAREVRLSTTEHGEGVIVSSHDGSTIRAKAAVITPSVAVRCQHWVALRNHWPPSHRMVVQVLRDGDISFSPPLAPHKVAALNRIHFGNAMKVLLKFNARPFPSDCHGIVCSDSFIPEMWMNRTTTPATPRVPGEPLPPQECVARWHAVAVVCCQPLTCAPG